MTQQPSPAQIERAIPLSEVYATGRELEYIEAAISNSQLSGGGPFTERCSEWLEASTGCVRALLTHSATAALEMAVALADIGPGDEVLMPSFTFVSTASAVANRGGIPVFVDIRPDTLNLDETKVAAAIGPRTKALLPVHYGGVSCAMDALEALARERGLSLIEDAAQGIGASYGERALGAIGALGCVSFHDTKNVTCGEGGALLINEPGLVDRAESMLDKGTDRAKFMRGEVDHYTWVGLGSSYLLSEIDAAFLWAQLERADWITSRRLQIWATYHEAFGELEASGQLRRPIVPPECRHNAHVYYLLLADRQARDKFIAELASRRIQAAFHYIPLHTSPAGRRYGRTASELPVTESSSERLVRIPLSAAMSDADVERVITAVTDALSDPQL